MTTDEANKLLAQYVANEREIRAFLRRPIVFGDWVYASNGEIAIRVPESIGIDADASAKISALADTFSARRNDPEIEIPPLPEPIPCADCEGTGVQYVCPDCDGDGEFTHGNHEYTCKECNGEGAISGDGGSEGKQVVCMRCGGSKHDPRSYVKVGKRRFQTRYLRKISALPGLVFTDSKEDAAFFRFDGGEGLLMSVRP